MDIIHLPEYGDFSHLIKWLTLQSSADQWRLKTTAGCELYKFSLKLPCRVLHICAICHGFFLQQQESACAIQWCRQYEWPMIFFLLNMAEGGEDQQDQLQRLRKLPWAVSLCILCIIVTLCPVWESHSSDATDHTHSVAILGWANKLLHPWLQVAQMVES